MRTYLHKVQEKHFKCLLINFSEKPQGRILISCFHVFGKSREEITQIPKSRFHAARDERLSSATVHYTYFITRVINVQQNTTHPSRVYWRSTLIRHYDKHISRDVTPLNSDALRMNF